MATTPDDAHDPLRGDKADADVARMHASIMRENAEPSDGFEPIPISLIFLFLALTAWGGWYISHYSGGWMTHAYDEGALMRPNRGGGAVAEEAPRDPIELGRVVFNRCSSCHGRNGEGLGGAYPPLAGSEWVIGAPETPVRIVLGGMSGPMTVAGQRYNSAMPAWGHILSHEQVAAVVTYIRQAWGNEASAVGVELVERVARESAGRKNRPWSAEELTAAAEQATPSPMP